MKTNHFPRVNDLKLSWADCRVGRIAAVGGLEGAGALIDQPHRSQGFVTGLVRCIGCASLALLPILSFGCQDSRTSAEVGALRAQVQKLSNRLAESDQQITQLETRLHSEISRGENVVAVEPVRSPTPGDESIARLPPFLDWVDGVSQRLQTLERELERMREVSARQSAEAAEGNQVGQVKTALLQVRNDVSQLEKGMDRRIDTRVRRMESTVSKLNSDLQTLQSRLRVR